MEMSIQQVNETAVVAIAGSIDALTADEVTRYLLQQIQNGQKELVADLSQVDFMSSAGLRAILIVIKEIRGKGGDFRLAGAQPGVEKILRIAGFTSILKTYASVPEAVASFESTG
jgi:anti-anti-sigma factor